jgi:hypothetical protein
MREEYVLPKGKSIGRRDRLMPRWRNSLIQRYKRGTRTSWAVSTAQNWRWRSAMGAAGQRGLDTQRFGLADQIRHRARAHFTHDLSTVNLNRDFLFLAR